MAVVEFNEAGSPDVVDFLRGGHRLFGVVGFGAVGPTVTQYYKMRAQDDGVALPGYVTWIVTDDPDFAGAGFSGGTPTPVGSMIPGSAIVAAEWEE